MAVAHETQQVRPGGIDPGEGFLAGRSTAVVCFLGRSVGGLGFGDVSVVRDEMAVVLVCWPVQRFSAETFVVCMGTVWKLQTSRCPHRR